MAKRDTSFSAAVRKVMREMDQPMHLDDIAVAFDMASNSDKKPLHQVISEMKQSGEIEPVGPTTYQYLGTKTERDCQPELREIMWRVLRARRSVAKTDLQELAGVSGYYAGEWLRMLQRQGIVERRGDPGGVPVWVMVSDPVEMPSDDDKAEKLRQLRTKKAEALAKIDFLVTQCLEVRMTIVDAFSEGGAK